ncbi:MAG: hypothetical protein KGJ13_06595 [Patescibacteria group bacterium]|nr:hypothetical protein [Patescibacteria group bacterium]
MTNTCSGTTDCSGSCTGSCSPPSDTSCPPSPSSVNTVSLAANPNPDSTGAPVTLTAVAGGTAAGTINYNFWWDCPRYANVSNPTVAGATVACGSPNNPIYGFKVDNQGAISYTVTHNYANGTYEPVVIIERGSAAPAEGRDHLIVNGAGAAVLNVAPGSLAFTAPQGASSFSGQNKFLTITNSGTANLNWTMVASTQSGGNWLFVFGANGAGLSRISSVTGADSSTNIPITVNASGLAPGTYNGQISITSNGGNATVPVTLTIASGPLGSHTECVANACKSVSGSGPNRCATDSDCGGDGSGGNMYAVCNAAEQACVNTSTPGTSCLNDGNCGGSGVTHLICENYSCVIASTAINGPSCSSPGYDSAECGASVTVTPAEAMLPLGGIQQFTAVVKQYGAPASDQRVTWEVNGNPGGNTTIGTITSGGIYTAPSSLPSVGVSVMAIPELRGSPGVAPVGFIAPPLIVSFTATPSTIVPPWSSELSWTVTGTVSGCVIDHGVGGVSSNGTASVSPSSTTDYTLTCVGPDGIASKTATVTVGTPVRYETAP